MNLPKIRIAGPEDEDELVAYARRFDGQWGFKFADGSPFPLSEAKIRDVIKRGLGQQDRWIAVIGEPGRIEASMYLFVNEPFYSDAPYLGEMWTTVLPEHRNSGNAAALMNFAKALSKALNLPLIMCLNSAERTEVKRRLFERVLGQKAMGHVFIYHHENDARSAGTN